MEKQTILLKDPDFSSKDIPAFHSKRQDSFIKLSWENHGDRENILDDYENPWLAMHFWNQKFGDSVPEHFAVWHLALDEIQKAKKENVRLEQNLIEAAVFHPHQVVAKEIGLNYKLTEDQLAFLLLRPDLGIDAKQMIKHVQRTRNRQV